MIWLDGDPQGHGGHSGCRDRSDRLQTGEQQVPSKGWVGPLLQASEGTWPGMTCGLRSWERTRFCCFKPLCLWWCFGHGHTEGWGGAGKLRMGTKVGPNVCF